MTEQNRSAWKIQPGLHGDESASAVRLALMNHSFGNCALRGSAGFFESFHAATSSQRYHLTDDAQRNLLRSRGTEIETGRRPNSLDFFRWHTARAKLAEN